VSVLDGYRVLDLSIAMSGPFAAMRLGDLGADVIKVEPVSGEWQRHVAAGGAAGNRVNVSFLSLNRNKRSLAVDLKSAEGRRLVHELAKTADVFLQNYRTGVAGRLGVDYDTIRALNPKIVYVSISGYGEAGPYAGRPGQDLILQGMSGAMFSAGRQADPPQPSPMYVVDAVTAYTAFEAALAGLLHRERTGEGQLVEVNMLDAIVTLQMQEMSVFTAGGLPQRRTAEPHAHCYIRAPYSAFATADGYLVLAFPPLARLGEILGIPALVAMDDERDGHARRDEIHRLVAGRLRDRPTADWLALFAGHDIWAGPVYSYADVVDDPQVRHNGSLISYEHHTEGEVTTPGFAIRFTGSPSRLRRGAPLTGEHTREILTGLGLADQQVDDLLAAGVVAAEQL
jgi:crotonobetainyl-CoA:carnitine CoA-transferase CaiB-like acyl-CoA transferase